MTGLSLHEILLFLAPRLAGKVHVTWATQAVLREAFAFLNQGKELAPLLLPLPAGLSIQRLEL